jgi:hypothetical protein
LTDISELVKFITSSEDETNRFQIEEVNKMMEFLMTMAVIALVFVAATILVALVAGVLLRLKNGIINREVKEVNPE